MGVFHLDCFGIPSLLQDRVQHPPAFLYSQMITGIPERPYRIDLLPCLTVEQARLFEHMFHQHMQDHQSRGEWFTLVNAKHLHKVLRRKMQEIGTLFRTFGYQVRLEKIELDGDRPLFLSSKWYRVSYCLTDGAR